MVANKLDEEWCKYRDNIDICYALANGAFPHCVMSLKWDRDKLVSMAEEAYLLGWRYNDGDAVKPDGWKPL